MIPVCSFNFTKEIKTMGIFMFLVIAVIAFIVGVFGFSQIIGALQNISWRPGLIVPMLLWIAILVGGVWLELRLFPSHPIPLIIGYVVSLLAVLSSGKIH